MLSFRSIVVAVAVFATVTSAIPTAAPPQPPQLLPLAKEAAGHGVPQVKVVGIDALGGGASVVRVPDRASLLHDLGLALPNPIAVPGSAAVPALPGLQGLPRLPSKRGQSCGDYIKDCSGSVSDIVVKIVTVIAVKDVDVNVVVSLLGEIVVLLQGLVADIKVIVEADLELGGVVCTVVELAGVVAGLLILVIDILVKVTVVIGYANVSLNGVILTIGALLYEVLFIVINLFVKVDLLVAIAVIIKPYVEQCNALNWGNVLAVLKL